MKRKAEEDLPSPAAPKRAKHSDSEEPQDDDQLDASISAPAGDEAGADDGVEDGVDDKDDKDDDGDGDNDDEDKDEEKDEDPNVKSEDGVDSKTEDLSAPALKRIPFPDKVSFGCYPFACFSR